MGSSQNKPVCIVETGERFESIAACAKKLYVVPQAVSLHLKGRGKTVAGVHVKFLDQGSKVFVSDEDLNSLISLLEDSLKEYVDEDYSSYRETAKGLADLIIREGWVKVG